jgi:hypothetical protein
MLRPSNEIRMLQRVLWFCGAREEQTGQEQAGTGTPVLVPEPMMVTVIRRPIMP